MLDIEVDGGVGQGTIQQCAEVGVTTELHFMSGSYVLLPLISTFEDIGA